MLLPAPSPLEVLPPESCDQIRRRVHELRAHWEQRRPAIPFFTLGAASYLDATEGRFEQYQEKAQKLNPLLAEHFGDLHQHLADGLSARLGMPVEYPAQLALPGFHVFLSHPMFTQLAASRHYDLQFEEIDWTPYGEVDVTEQLSITLSIQLPESGGGLWVWNINKLDMAELSAEEQAEHGRANRTGTRHAYQVGQAMLHSGFQLHQIAATKPIRDDDERITLQAHALPTADRWLVYW